MFSINKFENICCSYTIPNFELNKKYMQNKNQKRLNLMHITTWRNLKRRRRRRFESLEMKALDLVSSEYHPHHPAYPGSDPAHHSSFHSPHCSSKQVNSFTRFVFILKKMSFFQKL